MTYAEALAYFNGNASQMARALGLTRRAIYGWRERNRIPMLMQYRLQELSEGKLKRQPLASDPS